MERSTSTPLFATSASSVGNVEEQTTSAVSSSQNKGKRVLMTKSLSSSTSALFDKAKSIFQPKKTNRSSANYGYVFAASPVRPVPVFDPTQSEVLIQPVPETAGALIQPVPETAGALIQPVTETVQASSQPSPETLQNFAQPFPETSQVLIHLNTLYTDAVEEIKAANASKVDAYYRIQGRYYADDRKAAVEAVEKCRKHYIGLINSNDIWKAYLSKNKWSLIIDDLQSKVDALPIIDDRNRHL